MEAHPSVIRRLCFFWKLKCRRHSRRSIQTEKYPLKRVDGRKRETVNQNNSGMSATMALLDRMKVELPEIWSQAQVVGSWVWLELNVPPLDSIKAKLHELGFHWNQACNCWQNPCGKSRPRSDRDPRDMYAVIPAAAASMNEAKPGTITPKEFKVVSLRECPVPESMQTCETPENAADYWRMHIATNRYFNPECECLAALLLNTRRRVKGHQVISIGTLDTILVHPRDVFRGAVVAAAASIVLMHNLCA